MNKSVLALSTALSILAFSPAFAQETAPAPAAQIDCTVAANANDPACMNKQDNTTTGQSDSTTTTQPSTTTGQSDSTTTTTTGQSGTDATTDTTGSTAPVDNSTMSTTTATGGSLIVPAEQLNSAQLITASDFVGKTVYDMNGQNIGEVNDMVLSATGDVRAVILGVGGFLGIGEKSVAVSVDSIKMMQDGSAQRLVVEATKEMLEQAPSYDAANRRYTETTTTAPATGTGTTTTTEQPAVQQ